MLKLGELYEDPKVPTLKGTEASLSYVQCFLYLVSCSINVSIFHIYMAGYFLDRLLYIHMHTPMKLRTFENNKNYLHFSARGRISKIKWKSKI